MHIHILGICGTFMSGIAVLAKACGHEVTGSDMSVYPPMSTQLLEQGIDLSEGFDPGQIDPKVDCVIVGNVIKRGNPALEYVMSQRIPYTSGPAWLADHVLRDRIVIGVAGTHGKTTTSSLLAWILEAAGLSPGFLIGGIPGNFGVSARLGNGKFFVIEADEYDSAFFDKRPKFMHYRPRNIIFNNLEFDHADIFPDLEAIKQQFHFLVRTIPGNGSIIVHQADANLDAVLQKGCWSRLITFAGQSGDWQAKLLKADGSHFEVYHQAQRLGKVGWDLLGLHNVDNALAAIAAAYEAGVDPQIACQALTSFKNVKRRLEVKGCAKEITIYDDFAHHPTAIATTLSGLRAKIGAGVRMIAVLEFGSYTMRTGVHKARMQAALSEADLVICKSTQNDWGMREMLSSFKQPSAVYDDVDTLVAGVVPQLKPGDHVIIMSNSSFGGLDQKLMHAIERG